MVFNPTFSVVGMEASVSDWLFCCLDLPTLPSWEASTSGTSVCGLCIMDCFCSIHIQRFIMYTYVFIYIYNMYINIFNCIRFCTISSVQTHHTGPINLVEECYLNSMIPIDVKKNQTSDLACHIARRPAFSNTTDAVRTSLESFDWRNFLVLGLEDARGKGCALPWGQEASQGKFDLPWPSKCIQKASWKVKSFWASWAFCTAPCNVFRFLVPCRLLDAFHIFSCLVFIARQITWVQCERPLQGSDFPSHPTTTHMESFAQLELSCLCGSNARRCVPSPGRVLLPRICNHSPCWRTYLHAGVLPVSIVPRQCRHVSGQMWRAVNVMPFLPHIFWYILSPKS